MSTLRANLTLSAPVEPVSIPPSSLKQVTHNGRSFEIFRESIGQSKISKFTVENIRKMGVEVNENDQKVQKRLEKVNSHLEEILQKTQKKNCSESGPNSSAEASNDIAKFNEAKAAAIQISTEGKLLRRALTTAYKIDPEFAKLVQRTVTNFRAELKDVPIEPPKPWLEKKLGKICEKVKNFYNRHRLTINIGLAILGAICGILGFYVFGLTALAAAALAIFIGSPSAFISLIHTILGKRAANNIIDAAILPSHSITR